MSINYRSEVIGAGGTVRIRDTASGSPDYWAFQALQLQQGTALANAAEYLARAAADTGGFVVIGAETRGLPAMLGSDGEPVLLYRFVEVLEEAVDLEYLKAELPTLSYGQIAGGLAFLRRVAQFNLMGRDIDELEERLVEGSPAFQELIRQSLTDQETARVLNP